MTTASLSRDDVRHALGPIDDALAARIIATGATARELAEALAWTCNDEALINDGRSLPSGRVGQLVEIICALEQDEEEIVKR
jgi:hypothetical protein